MTWLGLVSPASYYITHILYYINPPSYAMTHYSGFVYNEICLYCNINCNAHINKHQWSIGTYGSMVYVFYCRDINVCELSVFKLPMANAPLFKHTTLNARTGKCHRMQRGVFWRGIPAYCLIDCFRFEQTNPPKLSNQRVTDPLNIMWWVECDTYMSIKLNNIANSTPFSLTLCHFRWHWDVKNTNYDIVINAICRVSVRF